ncbi:MAG: hypothetical protein AAGJ10_08880 [Bacteroidota bacterium]
MLETEAPVSAPTDAGYLRREVDALVSMLPQEPSPAAVSVRTNS